MIIFVSSETENNWSEYFFISREKAETETVSVHP